VTAQREHVPGCVANRYEGAMRLTLRQLQVFDAVATLGSVTKAAEKLNMSQSAASMALTDVQIVLGRPLFAHSKGRKLEITDEGKRLLPIVKSILGNLSELEQSGVDAPPSGRLVIGASPMIAETVLPRLCVEFMRLYPGVTVQIDVETTHNLIARLTRFELETALIEILPQIEGIELIRWRTDELVLVVAAGHPLAGRKRLRIKDLAGHSWCTREAQSSISAQIRYMVNAEIGQIDVALEASSNWAVRHAVIAGGGIGFLSKALVQYDLDNGRLVQLDVAGLHYSRSLSLARPNKIWRGQLTKAFEQFLLEHGDLPTA
jgi:DNA-binding transcriptional LysR family regulator